MDNSRQTIWSVWDSVRHYQGGTPEEALAKVRAAYAPDPLPTGTAMPADDDPCVVAPEPASGDAI